MRISIVVLLLGVMLAIAPANADERVVPVTDPVVNKECGSCHMVFPPQFLPKRSWQRLLERLSEHFGEDASLGDDQAKAILDYLLVHAADGPNAGRVGGKFATSIAQSDTPIRITETPRWVKKHREIRAERWKAVQSKANCIACHKAAAQGIFEED
jgi:cytochrome c5